MDKYLEEEKGSDPGGDMLGFIEVLSTSVGRICDGVDAFLRYPLEPEAMKMLRRILQAAERAENLQEGLSPHKHAAMVRSLHLIRQLFEERGWNWTTMTEEIPS